jgi:hypothetical protein
LEITLLLPLNNVRPVEVIFRISMMQQTCSHCGKRRTSHYGGKCRICQSNDAKYADRKRRYRQKQKTQKQSVPPPPKRKSEYPLAMRACLAELRCLDLVAGQQCGSVYRRCVEATGQKVVQEASHDTVHRISVEAGVCLDYEVCQKLANSDDLFIGIDESSKSNNRSFVEIEFGGRCRTGGNSLWSYPVALIEVMDHRAESMLQMIENALAMFVRKQQDLRLPHKTQLFHFTSITFDLTASNTGIHAGLATLLEKKRKTLWDQAKQRSPRSLAAYRPLVVKGCDDHLCALVSKQFEKRVAQLGTEWGITTWVNDRNHDATKNRVTTILHALSKALRKRWHDCFYGYLAEHSYPRFTIHRTTKTRYASFDVLALTVTTHKQILLDWINANKDSLAGAADTAILVQLCEPTVQQVIAIMALGAKKFLLPMMERCNHITSMGEYTSYIQNIDRSLWKLNNSGDALASQFETAYVAGFEENLVHHADNASSSSLEQLKFNAGSAPSTTDYSLWLAREWVRSALFILHKHSSKFLEGGEYVRQLRPRQPLKPTNRSGERLFALVNTIWKGNSATRAVIMAAITKIRASPQQKLLPLFNRYWQRFAVQKKARQLLDSALTRAKVVNERYHRLQETRQKAKQRQQRSYHDATPVAAFFRSQGWDAPRMTVKVMKNKLRVLKNQYRGRFRVLLGQSRNQVISNFKAFIKWVATTALNNSSVR